MAASFLKSNIDATAGPLSAIGRAQPRVDVHEPQGRVMPLALVADSRRRRAQVQGLVARCYAISALVPRVWLH
jgi:hypothetical protein